LIFDFKKAAPIFSLRLFLFFSNPVYSVGIPGGSKNKYKKVSPN
jgi:hypothetical protein